MDPIEKLELRVYPGADSTFYLYDDDGESYEYENGNYCLVPMNYSENERKLSLGASTGKFKCKAFDVNVVNVKRGSGV
ncbi:MAG: DUF5110 domain-containing protein, partial [Thermoprotei archaeon]